MSMVKRAKEEAGRYARKFPRATLSLRPDPRAAERTDYLPLQIRYRGYEKSGAAAAGGAYLVNESR